jgi:DNA (cytosine-5)-methyltransferase 1
MQFPATFTFVDLFAGVGGFHSALSSLGGACVYAIELDGQAAAVYRRNWSHDPLGDVTADVSDAYMGVPPHDVLAAGFPCQPFSKSGAQRGMEETRGTLYWSILRVIQERKPRIVILENVRNLAGPRHIHEWNVIIATLRDQGYRVSDEPAIFSPHLLPPNLGGSPQVRERVFITATYVGEGADPWDLVAEPPVRNKAPYGWSPSRWDLSRDLPLEDDDVVKESDLSPSEVLWIDAWNDLVIQLREQAGINSIPGFPLWADVWRTVESLDAREETLLPQWKIKLIDKNLQFYRRHRDLIDLWAQKWGLYTDVFPPSRRKLEWQAQDASSLWDTLIHFRPSGIRAKLPTYVPALVAITQTSVIGPRRRKLTVREAARLQGFPDWFSFGDQSPNASFRQLGNAVHPGVVRFVLSRHAARDRDILGGDAPHLLRALQEGAEEDVASGAQ